MNHPEYIYWAAVSLVAWPSALFSRCAGILAAVWAIGQVAYVVGLPEPETQIALYSIALLATLVNARSKACVAVAAIYFPLALLSALTILAPLLIWWSIFWLAMIQIALVPFTIDWRQLRDVCKAYKERKIWHDTFYTLRSMRCW